MTFSFLLIKFRLTEEFKIKNEEKKKIITEVESKQASLENLKPLVSKIVESVKPVCKLLDIEEQSEQMEE